MVAACRVPFTGGCTLGRRSILCELAAPPADGLAVVHTGSQSFARDTDSIFIIRHDTAAAATEMKRCRFFYFFFFFFAANEHAQFSNLFNSLRILIRHSNAISWLLTTEPTFP